MEIEIEQRVGNGKDALAPIRRDLLRLWVEGQSGFAAGPMSRICIDIRWAEDVVLSTGPTTIPCFSG